MRGLPGDGLDIPTDRYQMKRIVRRVLKFEHGCDEHE
jgi:hypothetical protein